MAMNSIFCWYQLQDWRFKWITCGQQLQVLGTSNVDMLDSSVWVSWEGGVVAAGKGSVVGEQVSFSHIIVFHPNHIYVTGDNAKWYFFRGIIFVLTWK